MRSIFLPFSFRGIVEIPSFGNPALFSSAIRFSFSFIFILPTRYLNSLLLLFNSFFFFPCFLFYWLKRYKSPSLQFFPPERFLSFLIHAKPFLGFWKPTYLAINTEFRLQVCYNWTSLQFSLLNYFFFFYLLFDFSFFMILLRFFSFHFLFFYFFETYSPFLIIQLSFFKFLFSFRIVSFFFLSVGFG